MNAESQKAKPELKDKSPTQSEGKADQEEKGQTGKDTDLEENAED